MSGLERWEGYDEQNWQQRFARLDADTRMRQVQFMALCDAKDARITALEAENERMKAFEARVLAAVSFAEPTDKTAQVEAAAADLRGGLSLRKCAAKHGLTFSQVRTIARQALGGHHDAD